MKQLILVTSAIISISAFAKPFYQLDCGPWYDDAQYGFSKNLDSLYINDCQGLPPNVECYWIDPIYVFPDGKVDTEPTWMKYADTTKIIYGESVNNEIINCKVIHKSRKLNRRKIHK